jgi:hypothetical protein
MFHHVLSSALSTVFNLALAILPAAPLFALKRLPAFAVKNKNGAQQKPGRSHPGKA